MSSYLVVKVLSFQWERQVKNIQVAWHRELVNMIPESELVYPCLFYYKFACIFYMIRGKGYDVNARIIIVYVYLVILLPGFILNAI